MGFWMRPYYVATSLISKGSGVLPRILDAPWQQITATAL
jgi:hypothetical protein